MIPAKCENCAVKQETDDSKNQVNLRVILGVIGGFALVGIIVFISVPLVRRRLGKKRARMSDIESGWSKSGWRHVGSRQSSFGHHHQESKPGPELLLPLLPQVSTFTWSDLRSQSPGDDEKDLEVADLHSFPTDAATMSHHSLQEETSLGASKLYSDDGGLGGNVDPPVPSDVALHNRTERSPTPPGLPSKPSSPQDPNTTTTTYPVILLTKPNPTSSNMEIVPEQVPTNNIHLKRPSSKPSSIQLPSPPASPPFRPPSFPRSQSQGHGHARSQSLLASSTDWRIHPSSRPPLASTASAPSTALPFRPTSNSPSAPLPQPSSTGVQLPRSPPQSPPTPSTPSAPMLTTAFLVPLQRSGSQSTNATSELARYPSVTTSQAPVGISITTSGSSASSTPSHSRPASVMSERPARMPQGARPRPINLNRVENTSGGSAAGRSSLVSTPIATPATDGHSIDTMGRAILRNSDSMHTPRLEESRTPEGQSVAPSYFDARHHTASSTNAPRTPRTAPPSTIFTSSIVQSPIDGPLSSVPSSYPRAPSSSRRSTPSHGRHSAGRTVPTLVKRKDSAALKPIPVSTLMQSPPNSPSGVPLSRGASSVSAAPSAYAPSSRSRSGSVVSAATGRESSGGSRDRVSARPTSVRPVLPIVEPLPPMEFTHLSDFSDDEKYP